MRSPRNGDSADPGDSAGQAPQSELDTPAMREAVAYLREWLPDQAVRTYRDMIRSNPSDWHRDPHFQGGIIVKHALLGNGVTARALGVSDLEAVWAPLLKRAVMQKDDSTASAEPE